MICNFTVSSVQFGRNLWTKLFRNFGFKKNKRRKKRKLGLLILTSDDVSWPVSLASSFWSLLNKIYLSKRKIVCKELCPFVKLIYLLRKYKTHMCNVLYNPVLVEVWVVCIFLGLPFCDCILYVMIHQIAYLSF